MRRPAPLLLLAAALACGGPGEPEEEARVYRVRGVVRAIPDPRGAADLLLVHHEPIPDFVDVTGARVGMEAMTMPFALDAAADVAGIAPGDKVLLTLRVDWSASPAAVVTALDKLPPETELDFRSGPR